MPYRSEKQRSYMHAKHPEIAERWDRKYGGKVVPKHEKSKRKSRRSRSKRYTMRADRRY